MKIDLLYFDDCPNWRTAHDRLDQALVDSPDAPELTLVAITTPDDAQRLRFRGSPSILIDGRDPFATGTEPVGLACRIYETPDGPQGSPTSEQIRAALASAAGAKR